MKMAVAFTIAAFACSAADASDPAPSLVPTAASSASATASASTTPRASFELEGDMQQGGVVRGFVPDSTTALTLNGEPVEFADDNRFIIAFGRDHEGDARLVARLADGRQVERVIPVGQTRWRISHVNVAARGGVSSAAFRRRRAPELERIVAARAMRTGSEGWRQEFQWPVTGRISSEFGSQRIYRGTPGSFHTGVDVARRSGTPIVAPADGVVILAANTPFTLEGRLLMIDHGMGLNSAFLHLSRIDVREGERVRRGQQIGTVGATGRATGPHLHWGMKWGAQRIDPRLLAGPMP